VDLGHEEIPSLRLTSPPGERVFDVNDA
jgi:hypothetical protein